MRNILAVFTNRNHTMQFSSYLKRLGVRNKTINTPRELTVSCGISILFLEKDFSQARFILSKGNFGSFKGFYIVTGEVFRKYQPI